MHEYRDATRLASWTQLLLVVFMLVLAWAVVADLLQLRLFYGMQSGSYTIPALVEAFHANTARQQVTVPLRLAAYVLSGALILEWTWRANINARGLGAAGMRYTPLWAVGWYFVPGANLLRPYDAMAEIWRASAFPQGWAAQREPFALRAWWVSLLFTVGLGMLAAFMFRFARSQDMVIDGTWYMTLSDLAGLLSGGVMLWTITRVQRMQLAQAAA